MECTWWKVTYRYSEEQKKNLWDGMNTFDFVFSLDMGEKKSV